MLASVNMRRLQAPATAAATAHSLLDLGPELRQLRVLARQQLLEHEEGAAGVDGGLALLLRRQRARLQGTEARRQQGEGKGKVWEQKERRRASVSATRCEKPQLQA